jgi:hypothetical protein
MEVQMTVSRRKLPQNSFAEIADTGRRGDPLSGCDCMQCFGRCLVDPELRYREGLRRAEDRGRAGKWPL